MELHINLRFKKKKLFYTKEVQRDVGFRFDMLSWWKLCDVNNIELSELGNVDRSKIIKQMIYASHFSYCIEHKVIIEYSQDECMEWFDQFTLKNGEDFASAMMKSQLYGKTIEQWGDKSEKK